MDKIVKKDCITYYVKVGEKFNLPYEDWIEIRCGTCGLNKKCQNKEKEAHRGCDKWITQ